MNGGDFAESANACLSSIYAQPPRRWRSNQTTVVLFFLKKRVYSTRFLFIFVAMQQLKDATIQQIMKIPQTIEVSVAAMQENEHNPRHITDGNFDLLVKSILTLPKMMYLRPTVADDANRPLGGNMRTRAQKYIASLNIDQIKVLLESTVKYKRLPDDRRCELVAFWDEWLMRPVVPVLYASVINPDEVQEFIIKDNTAYGEWDIDVLANEFDTEGLLDIDPELLPQSARDALAAANGEDVNPDDLDDGFSLPSGDKQPIQQMTFTLSDMQADALKLAIAEIKDDNPDLVKFMNGNKNTNGNALSIILRQWEEQRK